MSSSDDNLISSGAADPDQRTRFYQRHGKRTFDVVLATLGLLALWPVIALLAVLVGCKLGRPVLFVQERPGLHGRPFRLVKLRTMTDARDDEGRVLPDEARLTAFGKWLRSTSLDELPELWNVLKGDMSLVGPRPLLMEYLPYYSAEQARRHHVRPGITGLAQVSGRNDLGWERRFELDVWYVRHYSFSTDISIIARTVKYILKPRGIECVEPSFHKAHQKDKS